MSITRPSSLILTSAALGVLVSLAAWSYQHHATDRALTMALHDAQGHLTLAQQRDDSLAIAHTHALDSVALLASQARQKARDLTDTAMALRTRLSMATRPATGDSTNPRWMHRSLMQDTVIGADSVALTHSARTIRLDSMALAQARAFLDSANRATLHAYQRADTLSRLATSFEVAAKSAGCGLPDWVPCPSRKAAFVGGIVLASVVVSQKLHLP